MKHLTVDEMIEFVSITELNDETNKVLAKVNSHICRCSECLKKVRAFQMIYDEFMNLNTSMNFREYILSVSEEDERIISAFENNIERNS